MGLPSGLDVARKLGVEPLQLDSGEPESLWYYILKEAEFQEGGQKLGAVGSLIVCAVFTGILKGDPMSWLNVAPNWTPDKDPLLRGADKEDTRNNQGDGWTLASIIRLSGLPVSDGGVAESSAS